MRKKQIMAIVAGILLLIVAVLYVVFLKPRLELKKEIDDKIELIEYSVEKFTEYDVTDNSLVPIEGAPFSISIPENFTNDGTVASLVKYVSSSDELIAWETEAENMPINLLKKHHYYDLFTFTTVEEDQMLEGFKDLDLGMPEDYYHVQKVSYSVTEDDYSMWNYNQGLAYYCAASYNMITIGSGNRIYFYETDNKCAVIIDKGTENGLWSGMVTFYDRNNLNQPYALIMKVYDKKTAFAIINSIKF